MARSFNIYSRDAITLKNYFRIFARKSFFFDRSKGDHVLSNDSKLKLNTRTSWNEISLFYQQLLSLSQQEQERNLRDQ